MVTSRDVARLAGVSQPTVSRALSGSPRISRATVARVLQAAETLGYVPHAGAQAMKTSRMRVVGVVVHDVTNPFYPEIIDELTRELAAAGLRVVLWNTGGGGRGNVLKALREKSVDGVIFATAIHDSPELETAAKGESPIILINNVVDGLDCDQVASDNEAGGRLVADYFLEHGLESAAILSGPEISTASRDRAEGFLSQMSRGGGRVPDRWRLDGEFSHDAARALVERLCSEADRPRAIFCVNDRMAFGALDALRVLGLRPGVDCWVVGYDDVDMASWPSFDLTTVHQPSREMARRGTAMLLERIAEPGLPTRREILPCELIVRGSTSAAALPA